MRWAAGGAEAAEMYNVPFFGPRAQTGTVTFTPAPQFASRQAAVGPSAASGVLLFVGR
jgi:hypothetical protein